MSLKLHGNLFQNSAERYSDVCRFNKIISTNFLLQGGIFFLPYHVEKSKSAQSDVFWFYGILETQTFIISMEILWFYPQIRIIYSRWKNNEYIEVYSINGHRVLTHYSDRSADGALLNYCEHELWIIQLSVDPNIMKTNRFTLFNMIW